MKPLFRVVVLSACVAFSIPAAAQRPPADRRNFLACPVVRDTRTVPCFLAEWNGELYFLGIQSDTSAAWYPPQLGHKVLVEGTMANEPRVCGGIVLRPLVTSVMPELDASCNSVLPAEDAFEAPHAERGPGPSTEERSLAAPAPPPPLPQPPFVVRTFTVPFDFDNDFMPGRVTRIVGEAVRYAKVSAAPRVEVFVHRGATLLSDGTRLTESPLIAERRARKLESILRGLGLPAASIVVNWSRTPEAADGVTDPQKRRAVITVTPAGAAGASR